MLTSFVFALLSASAPAIEINVRDLKDGQEISRDRNLRVTVASESPIRSVEYYVGDDLRDSDSSTPYEFKFDPLNETEGKLKISFVAYDTEGRSAKKALNVVVATGVSLGADANIEKGTEALQVSKFEDAAFYGRVALKAKPDSVEAKVLLGRAFMGMGQNDKAQKFVEDASAAAPNNASVKELLAAINLHRAFDTLIRSGDRGEAINTMGQALASAATLRRQNLEAAFDAMPEPSDESAVKWGTSGVRAGRYGIVVSKLTPIFAKNWKNTTLGNLLAFAQVRDSNFAAASDTLRMLKKEDSMDTYSYALAAILANASGDDVKADEALAEAQGSDPSDLGLRTATAYLTMRRGRAGAMNSVVSNLLKDQGHRPAVHYYLSILQQALGNYEDARRAFEDSVLSEPALVDSYVERGNQALTLVMSGQIKGDEIKFQVQSAGIYFNAANAARPDSPQALTALALWNGAQGKANDAVKWAEAAANAGPNYAAGQYTAAMVFSFGSKAAGNQAASIRDAAKGAMTNDQIQQVQALELMAARLIAKSDDCLKKAQALDPKNLRGTTVPLQNEAWVYFARYGRLPLLTLPQ